ncbi:MAG: endonuclease domain-containing protein [Bacteroidota bacterium]
MNTADKTNNYAYNKRLQPFANSLKKNMTKAEACLWKYVLKARKMKGYQFRRQRPISTYIADFMCKELKLVIEVDGWTHTREYVYLKDITKQNELERLGFTLLRFTDNDVLNDIKNVALCIEQWIENNENLIFHPLPPPTGDIERQTILGF